MLWEILEKLSVHWREGGRLLDVAAASQPGGAGGGDRCTSATSDRFGKLKSNQSHTLSTQLMQYCNLPPRINTAQKLWKMIFLLSTPQTLNMIHIFAFVQKKKNNKPLYGSLFKGFTWASSSQQGHLAPPWIKVIKNCIFLSGLNICFAT